MAAIGSILVLTLSTAHLWIKLCESLMCTSCVEYTGETDDPFLAQLMEALRASGDPYCATYPYHQSIDVLQCPPTDRGQQQMCASAALRLTYATSDFGQELEFDFEMLYRGCESVEPSKSYGCNPAEDDHDRLIAGMGALGRNIKALHGTICYCTGPLCLLSGETTVIPSTSTPAPPTTPSLSSLSCHTCVGYYGNPKNSYEESILERLQAGGDPDCSSPGSGVVVRCLAPSSGQRVVCAAMNVTLYYVFEDMDLEFQYSMVSQRCFYLVSYQPSGCYDGHSEKTNILSTLNDAVQYITDLEGEICYCDESPCQPKLHCLSCLAFGGSANDVTGQAIISSLKLFGDENCLERPGELTPVECPLPQDGTIPVCVAGNITALYTPQGSNVSISTELYVRGCDVASAETQLEMTDGCSEVGADRKLHKLAEQHLEEYFRNLTGRLCQCGEDGCNVQTIQYQPRLRCLSCVAYGNRYAEQYTDPKARDAINTLQSLGNGACIEHPDEITSTECPLPDEGRVPICIAGSVQATYLIPGLNAGLLTEVYIRGCDTVLASEQSKMKRNCSDINSQTLGSFAGVDFMQRTVNLTGEMCRCSDGDGCNNQSLAMQPPLRCKSCVGYNGWSKEPKHDAILRELMTSGTRGCQDNPAAASSVQCPPPKAGLAPICVTADVTATKRQADVGDVPVHLYVRGCEMVQADSVAGFSERCVDVASTQVLPQLLDVPDVYANVSGDACYCQKADCNTEAIAPNANNTATCQSCLAYDIGPYPGNVRHLLEAYGQPECIANPYSPRVRTVLCAHGCVASRLYAKFEANLLRPSRHAYDVTMHLQTCADEFPRLTQGCAGAAGYEDILRWIFKDVNWFSVSGDICYCEEGHCLLNVSTTTTRLTSSTTITPATAKRSRASNLKKEPYDVLAFVVTVLHVSVETLFDGG